MALKKYKNLLTSGRSSTKDPKDVQILDLFGVAQIYSILDAGKEKKEVWDTRTIIGNNISVASNNAL